MSDFKVRPQSDLTTIQMLERYNLQDEKNLKSWAQLHNIDSSLGYYSPDEVDLIDHVHHHIYNLGMSIIEYQTFIEHRQIKSQKSVQEYKNNLIDNGQYNNYTNDGVNDTLEQVNNEGYAAIEMLKDQYSEAIDVMGERIADHFIDELDLSVMRHLVKKVKARQKLNGKVSSNRFMKTIKAVLQPQNGNFLIPEDDEDESSIEVEQNHRLD
ncbi:MAG: hypothetical protein O4861_16630 [Trichodesmium sp. St16_bin4-tuft]|uniref:Uncharacterized protein n=1 Tax=Trichodesmium erythraeum (strain IMS101) TaxID=203124 RepID=Q112R3_TRIEI|nr:hypothetical protein [Trichodesmium erythraeum GBRTRLIN201]MCH2047827.1 hypothetical protein [Trichodesmium sp. ALOHA_ZT_67]MCL2929953.1 hypothetical protein [Trichodesmium sp. MAG_R01]MDE5073420.1 hypothetical protein [Trichodesmium sp. St5_bin8]MDE5099865.1 hypothetical protein [Trichodesmium sp. St16_bin4-tuft]MDE5104443.1 hypothetical protein [Trichodesmium sp. St19_bin2]MDT9341153.1 hypothetical protein [Trichodesmium erythraeum 21-75]